MHPRFCALSSLSFALGSLRFNIWHLAPYIRSPAVVGALLLARGSVMLIERQNLPGRPGSRINGLHDDAFVRAIGDARQ
jgi:hypothetical protein